MGLSFAAYELPISRKWARHMLLMGVMGDCGENCKK